MEALQTIANRKQFEVSCKKKKNKLVLYYIGEAHFPLFQFIGSVFKIAPEIIGV